MMAPGLYPQVTTVDRLETHISYVFLAGEYAYKIKKPLNLGFLDFSELSRRRYFCEEEVRLNRRLAPDIYLDCIPICGSAENPQIGGDAQDAIEWAVRMRRFRQEDLLDRVLADGRLQPRHIDAIGRRLAQFHAGIAVAGDDSAFGTPQSAADPALENFRHSRELLPAAQDQAALDRLETWTRAELERIQPALRRRKAEGRIRECHGDLHLGNMILAGDEVTIFDCIEFNDAFRWIDVTADLAFVLMDLEQRGAPAYAHRLLNVWLEFSGDYDALEVLPFYLVYRAMVRAKVAGIRLAQPGHSPQAAAALLAEAREYLALAQRFTAPRPPFLLITHGVSGSGKSTLTGVLLEAFAAIRLRSDVVRKRLFGLGPLDDSHSAVAGGIYTAEASTLTYERMLELAARLLGLGYPVLVDATFPQDWQRTPFRELAAECNVPFVLLACTADPQTLRERVAARHASGHDAAEADLAVLEQQLAHYVAPAASEQALEGSGLSAEALTAAVRARIEGAE
ncbi:hypothetical protein C7443_11268 [Plasticicumulans acidivorans]|uniref:Aminoglycoside phosphotransferase domain-containing protein n=2 Tax=Plasticicumulans acidivorans TaxID=886464 RepID=A0A317MRS5_9GAMM|nr:hypothetical protein C7443_11268 [Plasticicumulans acidivorans]